MKVSIKKSVFRIVLVQFLMIMAVLLGIMAFNNYFKSQIIRDFSEMTFNFIVSEDFSSYQDNEVYTLENESGTWTFLMVNGTPKTISSSYFKDFLRIRIYDLVIFFASVVVLLEILKRQLDKIGVSLVALRESVGIGVKNLSIIEDSYSISELEDIKLEVNHSINMINESVSYKLQLNRILSHELKTPIQVLKGYNDLNILLSDVKYSDKIKNELVYMDYIINNILKDTEIALTDLVNVGELIKIVADEYLIVESKLIILEEVEIITNLNKLKQLLVVLFDNANKYSDGIIEIELSQQHMSFKNKSNNEKSGTGLGLKSLRFIANTLMLDCKIKKGDNFQVELSFKKELFK